MRQNKYSLQDSLSAGLLRHNLGSVNQKGFVELVNLKPWNNSLRYVTKLTGIETSEYPQVFNTTCGSFVCKRGGIYSILDGVWTLLLAVTDSTNFWSCADFSGFVVLSNGVNVVYVDAMGGISLTQPFDKLMPVHTNIAAVGAQAVLCGLDGSYLDLTSQHVLWSKIRQMDFSLSADNESGYHNPQIGNVLSVLPFEKGFIALGDAGVAKYLPAGVTFSYQKLSDTGIERVEHAASTGKEIYFVNIHSELCVIKGSGEIEVFGYDWLLLSKAIKLFWAKGLNELWIENLNGNYILNKFGLYQISRKVSGLLINGKDIKTMGAGAQENAKFRTGRLDFNIGGLKTLSEVYAQDNSNVQAEVRAIVTKLGVDYTSRAFFENPEGITYPHLTGNILAIERTTNDFAEGTISNFQAQTIRVDGRSGLGYTGEQK